MEEKRYKRKGEDSNNAPSRGTDGVVEKTWSFN
jgi:hypothetical protein